MPKAMQMPEIAPKTATAGEADHRQPKFPTLNPIEAAQIREVDQTDSGKQRIIAASAASGIRSSQSRRDNQRRMATAPAPMTPQVIWVFAPADAATGVRLERCY